MWLEFPDEVNKLVEQLVKGIQQELGHNLVGIYPLGSLAHGDFNPGTSDIDILVVTKLAIDDEEFQRMSEFHERIASLPNPYSKEIDITYICEEDVKEYRPNQQYPTLYWGESEKLEWSEHRRNWVLERWTMREYGKVYCGPSPRDLIKPISEDEIIQSVCDRLGDWAEWARNDNDPDWQLPNNQKVYFVETMCRAFYTLETGRLASKHESVSWSLTHLPDEWRQFVEKSLSWLGDESVDLSVNQPLRSFVLWVASSRRCAT